MEDAEPSGPLGERLHHEGRERGQLVSAKPGAFARIDRAGRRHPQRQRSSTSAAALRGWLTISIEQGFEDVSVLDLSGAALKAAKARLGVRADRVHWLVADATTWEPMKPYDIWHDRAAFHFLTDEKDRAAYIERLTRGLKAGGHAIIATFALDGPEKCSGLPVARYDAARLGQTLGPGFRLVHTRRHEHATPWDSHQLFQFSVFRREG